MVTAGKEYRLDTRPLSEFQLLRYNASGEHIQDTIQPAYPAGSIVQRVFWDVIDRDCVLYGKPYTPPGFEDDKHIDHRGHRQWEFAAPLRDDPTASARMIVLHTDVIDRSRYPEKDVRGVLLYVHPVSLLDVQDAGSWRVTEDVDYRRLFMQLSVSARDYTNRDNRRISKIDGHIEYAGRNVVVNGLKVEVDNPCIHFAMETETSAFYAGKSRNNAVVLSIAGQTAQLWKESQLSR